MLACRRSSASRDWSFYLNTANTWVCVQRGRRCVVILANDVRAEAAFPELVRFILGETGTPWAWEYGDMKFWKPE